MTKCPGVAQVCSKVGVTWMWSPIDGNLSGLCLGATFLLVPETFKVQSLNHMTSSCLKRCVCSQILFFLTSLKGKPFSKHPSNKVSFLNSRLAKTCLVWWTWFRNNWLRMVLTVCGLYYFISSRFGLFWIVANFSAIDRCVSHTYENSYNGP